MSFWSRAGGFLKKATAIASVVPTPLAPFARMAQTGLSVADALKRRRAGGGGDAATGGTGQDLGQAYQEAIAQEKQGNQGAGYAGLRDYDPSAAYDKYMVGAEGRFKDIVKRQTESLTGSAVGRDRLDTGFYNEDVGDLYRGIGNEFAGESSRAALQTAGMEQDRLRSVAGMDESSRDRYLDLVVGGLDRAQAASNAKRAERASTRNSVIGVVGDIAGTVISDQLRRRRRGGASTTAGTSAYPYE